jgi:peroxiredoxin/tetratricopeptide (TPR) repeat protein
MPPRILLWPLLSIALLVLSSFAVAQEAPAGGEDLAGPDSVLAGHSHHGEVFNEGPRQKAYLMGGTGDVHLEVTTRDPLAQKFFDQGVGQLHGFWYFEAERSFRQVAALDPGCAMAYWGMAMANMANEKRARGFIEEAIKRKKVSRREQRWIEVLASYLLSKNNNQKERRRQYVDEMEKLVHEYPDDVEAKAFLSVRLWQLKRDLPQSSHQRADELHDQIFAVNPMHPAHHYRIHLWDTVKPERALASAALCGQAAPSIAHMWHMPGHIYSRLHRYADAAWQQEASSRADHAHMMRDRVLPDQIHNYAHNQEWLCRNLQYVGRSQDALALAKNLIELPRHPRYNTLTRQGRSAFYGRMRLLQVLERFELWDEVLALADTMYLEPTSIPAEQIKRLRLLGLAYAGKGNLAGLRKVIVELQERVTPPAGKDEKKADAGPAPGKAPAGRGPRDRLLENAFYELEAYEVLLAGNPREALLRIQQVRGISKDRLAYLHLLAGQKDRAVELIKEAVLAAPEQVVPLAHQVAILHLAGKEQEAKEAFEKLRKISGHIDNLDTPVFQRLAPVARALKWPADWRQKAEPADDVGKRPPLDAIGPFRWSPPSALPWELPDAAGKTLSLSDYRGKPVLVIFYLGHGCLHCVEQLNSFAPKVEEFARAGISLVAISTDPIEDLKRSQDKYNSGERFPFPLVSDEKLEVFKRYRVYDDFEDLPLHGTFLIDAQGRVRWQDISYEPFTDPDFVLAEARRLLALHKKG